MSYNQHQPSYGTDTTSMQSGNNSSNNAVTFAGSGTAPASSSLPITAVPSLKVMRLQSPSLSQPSAGCLGGTPLFSSSLRLPDSFGVIHIGETFTAYLSALNTSKDTSVLNFNFRISLQTPSNKYHLSSSLDAKPSSSSSSSSMTDVDNSSSFAAGYIIEPTKYLSAVVSHALEEVGPHVLRVEVSYGPTPHPQHKKTIKKHYRFNVSSPLLIRELTVRGGDNSCFVSIAIENVTAQSPVTISHADFVTQEEGLTSERIGLPLLSSSSQAQGKDISAAATQKFDTCGYLQPGNVFRYIFHVKASNTLKHPGIAFGDLLGQAVFSWKKNMGESGKIASTFIKCPFSFSGAGSGGVNNHHKKSKFIVHNSGLTVDVSAAASLLQFQDGQLSPTSNNSDDSDDDNINRTMRKNNMTASDKEKMKSLLKALPVTVEPIDPPSTMSLSKPTTLQILIINHSPTPQRDLQLQFRLPQMSGVVICGKSSQNLGYLGANGGSVVKTIKFIALVAGSFSIRGCFIVDLKTGVEVAQPNLFDVFVEKKVTVQ